MPLFSSPRERRLWISAFIVVAAIYSTLGLARSLAGLLDERGLVEASFAVGMLLVAATIVAQGTRRRPGTAEIAIVLGVAAVYLLLLTRMLTPAERTHLIEYGVLGVFIYEALHERARQGRRVRLAPLLAILVTAGLGLIDECLQLFLPSRVFDPIDILFNTLAAIMAVVASVTLAWVRRQVIGPTRRADRRDA